MLELNRNQILLEISEDKKHMTVTLGEFPSMKFECCPKGPTQYIQNAVETYLEKTGLGNLQEWKDSLCCYKDGEGCSECN